MHASHAKAHRFLTAFGATSIVALFLPFTYNTSPLLAVRDKDVWPAGAPFFLAIAITAIALRLLLSGRVTRVERAITYILSAGSGCITAWLFLREPPSDRDAWIMLTTAIVAMVLGLFCVLRARHTSSAPLIALQAAYLTNALMCLAGFFGSWQRGAWVVLVSSLAYVTQMVLLLRHPPATQSHTRAASASG